MLLSKNGSALIAGVKASRLGRIVSGDAVERMNRSVGGAWIGGRLTASESGLAFAPSWLDRQLHEGLAGTTIPLASVKAVRAVKEGLSGALVIDLEDGRFCFRCNGAEQTAEDLSRITSETHRLSAGDAL